MIYNTSSTQPSSRQKPRPAKPRSSAADLAKDLREMHVTEYLLLKADTEGGQGEALNQPWLDEKSYVFLADVAGDWLADTRGPGGRRARGIFAHWAGVTMSFRFAAQWKGDDVIRNEKDNLSAFGKGEVLAELRSAEGDQALAGRVLQGRACTSTKRLLSRRIAADNVFRSCEFEAQ